MAERLAFQFYLSSIKSFTNLIAKTFSIQFQFYLSSIKSYPLHRILSFLKLFQFYLSSIKSLIRGIQPKKSP